MIYVDRGEEPEDLAKERSRQLARASIHGRPANIEKYGEGRVRSNLSARQDFRCAYCGKIAEGKGDPIDHFRPKACAEDVNWLAIPAEPGEDEVGDFFKWFDKHLSTDQKESSTSAWVKNANVYWWLAWNWQNLMLACVTCNSPTYKGNRFPLNRGTLALGLHEQPPANEQPLLLDPSRCDPLDHIRFAPDLVDEGWGPVPLTKEGRWTIAIFGLNRRPSLRTEWMNCAADIENNEAFKSFFRTVVTVTNDERRDTWDKLTRALLYQRVDYRAFRWCVFDHHLRQHKLRRLGLQLPRPWTVVPSMPRPVFIERPELAPFPKPLQMRVRALRSRLDETDAEELKNVLVELCGHGAFTSKELAAITDRKTPSHLESEYLKPLTIGPAPRLVYNEQNKTYRTV